MPTRYLKLFISIYFFQASVIAYGQSDKEVRTRELITSGNFIFKAQTALPSGGQAIQLTSTYDLSISKDTIVAYLPYYGRAYSAPVGSAEGGIKFTSSKFDYKIKERKKGGWEIIINPKDEREVQQIYLTISSSGYANLQVINTNRQPISFNGYIMQPE